MPAGGEPWGGGERGGRMRAMSVPTPSLPPAAACRARPDGGRDRRGHACAVDLARRLRALRDRVRARLRPAAARAGVPQGSVPSSSGAPGPRAARRSTCSCSAASVTRIARNARRAASLGAPGIDLNFGCPAKTVNRSDGGSVACCASRRGWRASSRRCATRCPRRWPLTVKIRLGYADAGRLDEIVQGNPRGRRERAGDPRAHQVRRLPTARALGRACARR